MPRQDCLSIFLYSRLTKLSLAFQTISLTNLVLVEILWLLVCWFAFNTIVMKQFLILLLSLFLSYQFHNYTIYVTIVIAYIYHVFGHLIQTIFIKKYIPGLLTGIFTSLFSLYYINDIPIELYGYSLFT